MKSKRIHDFFLYASHFTKQSIIEAICYWSQFVFKEKGTSKDMFYSYEKYRVEIKKRGPKGRHITHVNTGKAALIQTWLIDMLYEIICTDIRGTKYISRDESLRLIDMFNDYRDEKEKQALRREHNVILYLYGFMGEQLKCQSMTRYLENFSREKYILENIVYRKHELNIYNIDAKREIMEETGYTIEEYAKLLLVVWGHFTYGNVTMKLSEISRGFKGELLKPENIAKMINNYSSTIEELKNSEFERQELYLKPIIRINDDYIASNPFLLLSMFSSGLYWTMRNRYLKKDSTLFLIAYGKYFEIYVEEILEFCLSKSEYKRIEEQKKKKRADWQLQLGEYNILVEQKSSLASLNIKQSIPSTKDMQKYMIKTWGEAIVQLHKTAEDEKLDNAIKIILVYEDYFKSECLSEVFLLDKNNELPCNDGTYWLVNISEFEMLLNLYRETPDLALEIIKEKDEAERSFSHTGRELKQFFERRKIYKNGYLRSKGIYEEFEKLLHNEE